MNIFTKLAAERKNEHAEFVAKYGSNYDKQASCTFSLNVAEQGAVNEWAASLRAEIMLIQKKTLTGIDFGDIISNEPYYGAAGGGLTYAFIPTSLGTICIVTEAITKKSLNVAEATNWFFYG